MSIGSPDIYKEQCRVVHDFDDALIQAYANAAELRAATWLNRELYADPESLAAAIAAVPAQLTAANADYQAALAAAALIEPWDLREVAIFQAAAAFNDVLAAAKSAYRGMVMNEAVQIGCYLIAANFYANREADVDSKAAVQLPHGVEFMWQPYRVQMGV